MTWFKARWAELSTKLGLVLSAVSTLAQTYAQFDHRIAYAGMVAGVILALFPEKSGG